MSPHPAWFTEGANALAIGAAVMPAGRATCPFCQPEADGGDPEGWSVVASHAQLVTMNVATPASFTVSGSHNSSWTRTQINEGGDAATCAWRTENVTGRDGGVDYEFTNSLSGSDAVECLPIATGIGVISGTGGTLLFEETQSDTLTIIDHQTGTALCGSTGCTAGDFGAYDDDSEGEISVEYVGSSYVEKFCRDKSTGGFRYTFTGQSTIGLSEGGFIQAYLYTGDWDWTRFGGEPAEASDPDYTLSAEESAGSVRGFTIKVKYLTYSHSHAASTISGTPSDCPTPDYSSDVTTGTTTGSIEVSVSG